MSLAALYLTLAISLGLGGARVESVSLDPWLLARTPGDLHGLAGGITLPGAVWVSTNRSAPGTLAHELKHVRQVQELGGPGFLTAYALTWGRPFEDYRDSMWEPPPRASPRCPLFTWTPPTGGLFLWRCATEGTPR